MKNKFISLLVTVLCLSTNFLFSQTKTGKLPDIKFRETTFNFSEVNDGSFATHVFNFKNTGTGVLKLKDVHASCGCTTPSWPHDSIMPGDSGKITVTFNSSGYAGRTFAKSITVTTNIPENGQDKYVILYIQGNVVAKPIDPPQFPLKFSEGSHNLNTIQKGKTVKWTVELKNDGDSTVKIKELIPSCVCIKAKAASNIILPHKSIVINLSYSAKNADPKEFSENLKVNTNIPVKNARLVSDIGYFIKGSIIAK